MLIDLLESHLTRPVRDKEAWCLYTELMQVIGTGHLVVGCLLSSSTVYTFICQRKLRTPISSKLRSLKQNANQKKLKSSRNKFVARLA